MRHPVLSSIAAVTLCFAAAPFLAPGPLLLMGAEAIGVPDDDWIPKRSPFTAVEWNGDEPRVRYDGTWYALLELDGFDAATLVEHCKERHGRRWRKRFCEDLVQVLWEMGHEPGGAVSLVLREDGGARVTIDAAPMTEANRRAVWEHRNADDVGLPVLGGALDELHGAARVDRVEREHATDFRPQDADLARPLVLPDWADAPSISREQAQADLDQLEWLVRHRFSYRDLTGVDVAAVFDAARVGLNERVSLPELDVTLRKLMARFGDGHARVDGSLTRTLPPEYAPFLVEGAQGGAVAYLPDRSALLDTDHPFVVAIDGVPLERWIDVAASVEARGAAHTVRRRGERNLRYLGWLRAELDLPRTDRLTVTLANDAGERVERELRVSSRKPNFGEWPRVGVAPRMDAGETPQTDANDEGIAYLRVARMDDDARFLADLERRMDAAIDADAWVIDVRDNGGGTRDVLRAIAPRLLDGERLALVANVGAYRLAPGEEPEREGGYLADRFLFPADWDGWSDAQRAAIATVSATFRPDRAPTRGEFSELHWFVIDAAPSAARFPGRVAVLVDEDCFSATDIFLGALAELPRVTLVGRASGGGSGRSRGHRLAHSGLEVRLSTMASFRPNGARYDGVGVAPDVEVFAQPADFVTSSDAVLDAAVRALRAD